MLPSGVGVGVTVVGVDVGEEEGRVVTIVAVVVVVVVEEVVVVEQVVVGVVIE
jgi:hypothetical protein